jgi:hypothetical protein
MTYTPRTLVIGNGQATAGQIDAAMQARGQALASQYAPDGQYQAPPALGQIIIDACRLWLSPNDGTPVNHDIVAAQVNLETAGWQSAIARDKNNPAGLGAEDDSPYDKAIRFTTSAGGIRAQVAHLLSYVIGDGPWTQYDPRYQAVKDAGWLGTVTQLKDLGGKWATSQDYGQSVADLANDLLATQGNAMAGDDDRFAWTPDPAEFGYPDGTHGRSGQSIELLILHITAGTDSQDWLLGGNGSSTHYLTDRAGRPRSQMVREADAAWTAGNRLYNQRGINVEVEMRRVTDWTDAIMQETARTIAPIMARNNIPAVYLGRANGPGKRGMIGHRDVPNPLPSSTPNYCGPWGGSACHSDPGAGFDWTTFTGYVAAALASATPPQPNPGPSADTRIINGYTVQFGFKALYEALERAGLHTQCLGLPLGNEIPAPFAGVDSMQVWERGYLVFQKAENPDVTVATRELWPQLEEAKP